MKITKPIGTKEVIFNHVLRGGVITIEVKIMAYKFFTKHAKKLQPYTDAFASEHDAIQWYENYGKSLEKRFNRKLTLQYLEI